MQKKLLDKIKAQLFVAAVTNITKIVRLKRDIKIINQLKNVDVQPQVIVDTKSIANGLPK